MKRIIALTAAVCLLGLGCDGDDASDETAAGTTATSSTTTGPVTAQGSSSSGAADGSSSGPGTPGLPQCVRSCMFPGECCPFDAVGCPSSDYPYNFSCEDNACAVGGCSSDAECDGLSCIVVDGVGACLQPCADDPQCAAIAEGGVCVESDDPAAGYCFLPCTAPGASCGNSDCDETTGRCTCSSSSQCTVGFECR